MAKMSTRGFQETMLVPLVILAVTATSTAYQAPLLRPARIVPNSHLSRSSTQPKCSRGFVVFGRKEHGVLSLRQKADDGDVESMYQTVNGVMTDVVTKVDSREEKPPPRIGVSATIKKGIAAVVSFGVLVQAFAMKWWQMLATAVMAWWLQLISATQKASSEIVRAMGFEDEATKKAREEQALAEQKEREAKALADKLAEEERARKEEQARRNKERWDFAVGVARWGAKKVVEGTQSTATTVSETAQKAAPVILAVGAAAAAADLTDVAAASVAGMVVATAVVDLAVNEKRRQKGMESLEDEKAALQAAEAAAETAKTEQGQQDKLSRLVAERAAAQAKEPTAGSDYLTSLDSYSRASAAGPAGADEEDENEALVRAVAKLGDGGTAAELEKEAREEAEEGKGKGTEGKPK